MLYYNNIFLQERLRFCFQNHTACAIKNTPSASNRSPLPVRKDGGRSPDIAPAQGQRPAVGTAFPSIPSSRGRPVLVPECALLPRTHSLCECPLPAKEPPRDARNAPGRPLFAPPGRHAPGYRANRMRYAEGTRDKTWPIASGMATPSAVQVKRPGHEAVIWKRSNTGLMILKLGIWNVYMTIELIPIYFNVRGRRRALKSSRRKRRCKTSIVPKNAARAKYIRFPG